MPSAIPQAVKLWKEKLGTGVNKERLANRLADHEEFHHQVPDFEYALLAEKSVRHQRGKHIPPATTYDPTRPPWDRNIVSEFKQKFPNGVPSDLELDDVNKLVVPPPVPGSRTKLNGLDDQV